MIKTEQVNRFLQMDDAVPRLHILFGSLTGAHQAFQGNLGLRSISVSDQLEDSSIEAAFNGVRIKFKLLMVFGIDHSPRARVLCTHCHSAYGTPAQTYLGAFGFDPDGSTDLDPAANGDCPRIDLDAPAIVLHFLQAAFTANRSL